ncbi:MAG: putative membrane protein YphA (DoxX/SURF4 family) [Polaribacter sp.]|jgi:uncharacterized membrane protein YphA (DoxX/SURF4 family)
MTTNQSFAILTLRLLLGFIFLMQGFGKVFKWGVANVYDNFFKETYQDLLPDFLIQFTAYYTSYVELIAGFMLVIGLKRDWALYALASVLVIVTFGHGMTEPVWDLSHVMYRVVLLVTLLLLPKEWDKYSVDGFLRSKH